MYLFLNKYSFVCVCVCDRGKRRQPGFPCSFSFNASFPSCFERDAASRVSRRLRRCAPLILLLNAFGFIIGSR